MISKRHLRYTAILVITLGFLVLTWSSVNAGDNGGHALNFGGASHIVIPEGSVIDNLGLGSFTLEAWVYAKLRDADLSIIRDHHDYSLYINSVRDLVAYVFPQGDRNVEDPWIRIESTDPVAVNQWHHVAAVWNGSTSAFGLYVDGNPVAANMTIESPFGLTATMWIGANAFVPGQGFDGYIDEVRIWTTARTTADIRSTMFHELAGTESNLAGYWPLNETSGTTTTDATGRGNDGTLDNGTDPVDYPQRIPSTAPLGSLNAAYQTDMAAMWVSNPTTTANGGLNIANVTFLQDTGDDIIFGHNNAAFQCCVTANLLTTPHATKRWARLWQLDVTDMAGNGGNVDLTFDISDAGGTGTFSPTGNYYLLKRPTNSAMDFAEVPATFNVAGDQVTFHVAVTELGSEFTLGADTDSPTAVSLASFTATSASDHNTVAWETASELNNLGFNVWRGMTAAAPDVKLNTYVIPSQAPGGTAGFAYSYDDFGITSGVTYYYWLEDVDLNGTVTRHGPVSTSGESPTAITLTGLAASPLATTSPLTAWSLLAVGAIGLAGAGVWLRRRKQHQTPLR